MSILVQCPICRIKSSVRNKKCVCGQNLDNARKQNKAVYYIKYRFPPGRTGKQITEKVGTDYRDALAAEGKRKGQVFENKILEITKDKKITFNDLMEWFIEQPSIRKLKYYKILRINLKSFCEIYGQYTIYGINVLDLKNYQIIRKEKGLSDSYVDQEIGAVRNMLNTAWEGDKISGDALAPFKKIKKLLKKHANARDIIINYQDFLNLMDALPEYARNIVATAFYTGMRRTEVLGLTWDRVNLDKRVITLEASHTKTNEMREIPISDNLLEILKSITRVTKNDEDGNSMIEPHVFLYKGYPLKDIRWALRSACKKVGLPYGRNEKGGITFHDLRHTFNTNMRRSGVHDTVIMKITGHSTREMFDRYNTVDGFEKVDAVRAMEKGLSIQIKNSGGKHGVYQKTNMGDD